MLEYLISAIGAGHSERDARSLKWIISARAQSACSPSIVLVCVIARRSFCPCFQAMFTIFVLWVKFGSYLSLYTIHIAIAHPKLLVFLTNLYTCPLITWTCCGIIYVCTKPCTVPNRRTWMVMLQGNAHIYDSPSRFLCLYVSCTHLSRRIWGYPPNKKKRRHAKLRPETTCLEATRECCVL